MGEKLKTPLDESKRLYLNAMVHNYKEVCGLNYSERACQPEDWEASDFTWTFNEVSETDEFLDKLKPYI
ncbi:MAG: hypothetical protein ACERKS_11765 [Candidatus Bathyarchaeota archaeon]